MLDGRSTLPCSVRKALYRAFREKHPTVIGGGALRPVFRRTFVPFTLKGPVDQRAQPDAPARGRSIDSFDWTQARSAWSWTIICWRLISRGAAGTRTCDLTAGCAAGEESNWK